MKQNRGLKFIRGLGCTSFPKSKEQYILCLSTFKILFSAFKLFYSGYINETKQFEQQIPAVYIDKDGSHSCHG